MAHDSQFKPGRRVLSLLTSARGAHREFDSNLMVDPIDLQRHVLAAAFRRGGGITVIETFDGKLSVRVGTERIAESTEPLDDLIDAGFVRLVGRYDERRGKQSGGEVRVVQLYELTSAGRDLALDLGIGPRTAEGGEAFVGRRSDEKKQ